MPDSRFRVAMVVIAAAALAVLVAPASSQPESGAATRPPPPARVGLVHVDMTPGHELNAFDPDSALGSSLDVLSKRDIDLVFTPHILQECLSAGWGPITYRNNTELGMAAWHWNENGSWSDAGHQRGYFTGSTELKEPIRYILAYNLPHRGFATSGDAPVVGPTSYWKSNPYLTSHFTGQPDASLPQWVIVDLKSAKPVNAIKIEWANPYATTYQVESWSGRGDPLDFDSGPRGEWKVFANGSVKNGKGGTETIKLADAPANVRYVRILMSESSNTPNEQGGDDIRNRAGYAIQSITLGTVDASGTFTDATPPPAADATPSTRPAGRNTGRPSFCASSIDPWHTADNARADGGYQHTGFDLFFQSGITNHLPAMIPVTLLYGTPDDAAAQIAYLKKRGYDIGWVEIGEEPDGKHCMPEDYAALYIQWADAIHKVDPKLKLGGPIFEGVTEDITVWPDAKGRVSWMGRFVDYLREHDHLKDLAFVSFEHYPYGSNNIPWSELYDEPKLMKGILENWRKVGVPKDVPLMNTESSVAAGLCGRMSQNFASIWLCDSVGSFFEGGGAVYFHSPIQPQTVNVTRSGPASWSNFVSDRNYTIKGYTAFYWAAHMINLEWTQHRAGVHRMFPSTVDIKDGKGNLMVTSYAVHRPDGNWSVMLVNRDENNPHTVRVVFTPGRDAGATSFAGPVRFVTFGAEQYVWQDHGVDSYADPDGPPLGLNMDADHDTTYTLPKASVTVLRGHVK